MNNLLFSVKHRTAGVISNHATKPEAKEQRDALNKQEKCNEGKPQEEWELVHVVTEGPDHWRNSW